MRLIDAERLIEVFDKNLMPSMVETLKQYVDMQPTVDAAPVVHAEWDEDGKCTVCGSYAPFPCLASTYYKSCYCHNCGAKMDGGFADDD
jgi:hypothetical protein